MHIRPVPLYGILTCGIVIVIIGAYLLFNETAANGFVAPGKHGSINGAAIAINGRFAIIFGLVICIFPLYQLIKQRKKKY